MPGPGAHPGGSSTTSPEASITEDEASSTRHFWTPGYYRWNGREHVWMGGRWEMRRDGYEFIGPRWVNRFGRFEYLPGRWVRR